MEWEESLWAELEALPEVEQIAVSGFWIVEITQKLLPKLGQHRREAVLRALDEPGMDPTRLAEMIGTRRGTILRLAEEGRAQAGKTISRRRTLAPTHPSPVE